MRPAARTCAGAQSGLLPPAPRNRCLPEAARAMQGVRQYGLRDALMLDVPVGVSQKEVKPMRVHGVEPRPGDAEEIRALYHATMEGWNAGSGEAFAAPFAEEADFIAFDGTRFHGREEIARFHDPLFKTHLKGTRLVGDVTDVRFVAPDAAVLHARGGAIMRGRREPARERDSLQTMVAVRNDGRWQLAAFQNTRVRPIGRNVLGTIALASDRLALEVVPAEGAGAILGRAGHERTIKPLGRAPGTSMRRANGGLGSRRSLAAPDPVADNQPASGSTRTRPTVPRPLLPFALEHRRLADPPARLCERGRAEPGTGGPRTGGTEGEPQRSAMTRISNAPGLAARRASAARVVRARRALTDTSAQEAHACSS